MKKILLFLSILSFFQASTSALDASITYATFKSPETNYVEINLFLMGNTVNHVRTVADTSLFQSGVEVIILFKQNDEIIKFDKYNLQSPVSPNIENFVDLKRYSLENGDYDLEVSVQDLNDATNVTKYSGKIQMDYAGEGLLQSDLQLLSTIKPTTEESVFVKNGQYQESLPFNFYSKNAHQLIFYNEVYNANKVAEGYLNVSYGINQLRNENKKTVTIGHKKKRSRPVNALLVQMDISDLSSGNYELFVEIRNKEKELLSRKTINFQRSNPYYKFTKKEELFIDLNSEFVGKLSFDELQYSIRAIAPLVKDQDVDFVNTILSKRSPDTTAMQRFLFNFWVTQEPNQPEILYGQYMEVARAVDKMYAGGFGYGFESDRGFIYMKYGRPDDIVAIDNDSSAPPYEIWIFNDFPKTKQTNVKFLFYEPGLGTDFQLLHSNARGEINNPQWQITLYKNAPNEIQGNNYIDATQMQDNFNRHASRYFNDF